MIMCEEKKEVDPALHEAAMFVAKRYARSFGYDVDELYNEAFLGLIGHEGEDRNVLLRIAQCDILDFLRKERRQKRFLMQLTNDEDSDDILDTIETTINLDSSEEADRLQTLNRVIEDAGLSEREKRIIFLRYYKGYTFEQIGKEFNLRKSTISQLHAKLITIFREILNDLCGRES